jgi:hypothetical protein
LGKIIKGGVHMVRGRRKKLTIDIKDEIIRIWNRRKDMSAKEIQDELRVYLTNSIRKTNSNLDLKDTTGCIASRLPGTSAIEKYMKTIYSQKSKIPLDQPWSIGNGFKYNIPSDVARVIIDSMATFKEPPLKLTVREARWYAYLFPIALPILQKVYQERDELLLKLNMIVQRYASEEKIFESQKKEGEFDTSELDDHYLIVGDWPTY